ncbi:MULTISPECIES: ABC transporter ATP-binding protein [unclassified Paenibacillus]|uniref:ABC transporter ATP-binding protein n=1 Tax=unclassified Paenibacillus TaxID=185978 RepID=UPI000BA6159D|nr:ABC transporter ATP-binding protein [Paenibacillus sp. 7541]PAK49782.1 ABC transporter ATP-binding protein [Paenibacillus sp. 7541]
MITAHGLGKSFGETTVLSDVDFSAAEGEWWGIIGPNGSGKSTLLHLLSGIEKPTAGSVRLLGREVGSYSRKEIARMMAVLQQEGLAPSGFTVREVLEMGRYPFQNWLGREHEDPSERIEAILNRLDLTLLADKRIDELSGGQRQRAALGKVMAQEPTLLLLDEPTTYLDIRYQQRFMDLVAGWRKESGITVISVLHDLNLAAQYCDRLLILHNGTAAGRGLPEEVLTEDNIRHIFQIDPAIVRHPVNGAPQVLITAGDARGSLKED